MLEDWASQGTFLKAFSFKCVLKCELGLTWGPQECGGGTLHGGIHSEGRRNLAGYIWVGAWVTGAESWKSLVISLAWEV